MMSPLFLSVTHFLCINWDGKLKLTGQAIKKDSLKCHLICQECASNEIKCCHKLPVMIFGLVNGSLQDMGVWISAAMISTDCYDTYLALKYYWIWAICVKRAQREMRVWGRDGGHNDTTQLHALCDPTLATGKGCISTLSGDVTSHMCHSIQALGMCVCMHLHTHLFVVGEAEITWNLW